MIGRTRAFAFCIGLLLLVLNLAGLFIPLRNPALYKEPRRYQGTTLTEEQVQEAGARRNEPIESYVVRLNNAVRQGTVHYWDDDGINKYRLRVPPWENYLLFIAGYLKPNEYRKYEYCNYAKAISRGVGFCSQRAIIVSEILKENGVDSRIIGLEDHVVAMAQVDQGNDVWWVVDPDFGVVIDHDIDAINKTPEIIKSSYAAAGYDEETIGNLLRTYGASYHTYRGVKEYRTWKVYYFERLSYLLTWIIPILLIYPYMSRRSKGFGSQLLSRPRRRQPNGLFG